MNILLVHAQPERSSVTRRLVDVAVETLTTRGHDVVQSDLYGMRWKAAFDGQDFPCRRNQDRLSFIEESAYAYAHGCQTPDVMTEQNKVLAADAVILLFPLWWFGMPAIMKGWIDRVWAYGLAYGYQGKGNKHRYGEGGFAGKRALLAVSVGGPEKDYSRRGINGPLEQLLHPVTHGTLFYTGMQVLPTFAVYGTGRIDAERMAAAESRWQGRLERLFLDKPIPFRAQNGGDYPDGHVLAAHIAPDQYGLPTHIAEATEPTRTTRTPQITEA